MSYLVNVYTVRLPFWTRLSSPSSLVRSGNVSCKSVNAENAITSFGYVDQSQKYLGRIIEHEGNPHSSLKTQEKENRDGQDHEKSNGRGKVAEKNISIGYFLHEIVLSKLMQSLAQWFHQVVCHPLCFWTTRLASSFIGRCRWIFFPSRVPRAIPWNSSWHNSISWCFGFQQLFLCSFQARLVL